MSLESNLQKRTLEYLNSLSFCVAENVSGNATQSGRADINGCIRGRNFRLELKVPDNKNKASKKQEMNLRRWSKAGAVTMVSYSLDFVKLVFTEEGITKSRLLTTTPYYEENGCESWVIVPSKEAK